MLGSLASVCSRCCGCGIEKEAKVDSATISRRSIAIQCQSGIAAESLPIKLTYVDLFLRWDCGPDLLQMGLFPNTKEISESMACLMAIDKVLSLSFKTSETLCVVVGDGCNPRTAALIAMRTKWKRIVSVDPDLAGLPVASCQYVTRPKVKKFAKNPARRDAHNASFVARRVKMQPRLVRVGEIRGLELLPYPVQDVTLDVADEKHVVILLPHAHVIPDEAMSRLRLKSLENLPTISVVQLPCCQFVKHNRIWGQQPDSVYFDDCICSTTTNGNDRLVRVWRDLAPVGSQGDLLTVA